ncbi:NUDIX domain-containing protein [Tardiphaga sp. vice352]|uniref:NUDIX domain-containing protein n=1 Tax=unclassified Tardiphaga TaxID=2631404 RepID=UPI00116318CC|nr:MULTISPECIES: NUDIX domain-containing protein [unclassified Tardiphaga]QDM28201.1 NUDIX domain-containing protein [Tardiphaga sp. vice304]QDM33344.1 NUDIX domain-containing protein [Tardiphaga sp. vice352]
MTTPPTTQLEVMPTPLSDEQFRPIVRYSPLISIDLLIRDELRYLLLGMRNNEPARGTYFVPGGCIRKDETIATAFARIASEEIALDLSVEQARFAGIFEQMYPANRFSEPGYGTHYVALAYQVTLPGQPTLTPDSQHRDLIWMQRYD